MVRIRHTWTLHVARVGRQTPAVEGIARALLVLLGEGEAGVGLLQEARGIWACQRELVTRARGRSLALRLGTRGVAVTGDADGEGGQALTFREHPGGVAM